MKIYFAAPLFTAAEKRFNKDLAVAIANRSADIEILLPQEFAANINKDDNFFRNSFKACLDKIDESDLLLAITDGPDSDSGTCFEMGYAFAKGTPIIALRTDFRASEDRGLNLMISQSADILLRDMDSTIEILAARIVEGIKETFAFR